MEDITQHLVELVKSASTDLSPDVETALERACATETEGSASQGALKTILENVHMSRDTGRPICQDTGTPIFYVWHPEGVSQRRLTEQIRNALQIATERAYLRPNAVAALSGKNSGDNTGVDFPTIHFHEWDKDHLHVDLLLKGGGSENVSDQYKLPNARLKAGRDLDGVRKVVLDSVYQAQGKGCSPGVLGITIGGDRGSAYVKAKQQLLRPLDDKNPVPELSELEDRLYEEINKLGIGPMGLGGKATTLGVKIGAQHRHPASFFVSIAYMCWACRRASMDVSADGEAQYA